MSQPAPFERHRKRASRVVQTYIDGGVADDPEAAITDLIADLGHYAQSEALDFPVIARRAIAHWLAETEDPDNLERPHVAIHVDGLELGPELIK